MQRAEARSYAAFASARWYTDNLMILLKQVPPLNGTLALDLGCGSAAGTRLIALAAPGGTVVGIDCQQGWLEVARDLTQRDPRLEGRVSFRRGDASQIDRLVDEQASRIYAFNSVHLFGPIEELARAAAVRLAPGGVLAFMTSYFTPLKGTETVGSRETARLMVAIMREARERFPAQMGCFKPRSDAICISAQQAAAAVQGTGLYDNVNIATSTVHIPRQSLAEFLLLGQIGAKILPVSIPPAQREELLLRAMDQLKIDSLPRQWMYFSAVRRGP